MLNESESVDEILRLTEVELEVLKDRVELPLSESDMLSLKEVEYVLVELKVADRERVALSDEVNETLGLPLLESEADIDAEELNEMEEEDDSVMLAVRVALELHD